MLTSDEGTEKKFIPTTSVAQIDTAYCTHLQHTRFDFELRVEHIKHGLLSISYQLSSVAGTHSVQCYCR
jgi:hypothetical protein